MRHLRLAFGFLTILPTGRADTTELAPARAYFPLVGLALGGILAGLDIAAREVFPVAVTGALLVIAMLVLTRALHTEGFLDVCDGLLGGFTPERRLEILKDTRVGAFAVIGGASLLLAKWSLFTNIPDDIRTGLLVLFPCLSRYGMVVTMAAFTYVRSEGLGAAFQLGRSRWQLVIASAIAGIAASLIFGHAGLILLSATIVVASLAGRWFVQAFGGMTGDAYGAVNEIGEVAALAIGIGAYGLAASLFQGYV